MSIKINWWLRETSWALFLLLRGNWNGSAVLARRWPGPGAAKYPCQAPLPGTPARHPPSPSACLAPALWGRAWGKSDRQCLLALSSVGGCLPLAPQALRAGSRYGRRSLPSIRCCGSLGQDLAPQQESPSAHSCRGEQKRARMLHSDPGSALDTNGLQITIINYRRWDNLPTVMLYYHGC